jgi:hypothetical protein
MMRSSTSIYWTIILCKNGAKPFGGIKLEPMITLMLIDFTAVAASIVKKSSTSKHK